MFFLVFVIGLSMVSSLFVKIERRGGGATWVMRVNGAEISYKDFTREVARQSEYLNHIRAQYGQYADLLMQSMGWSIDPKSRALDAQIKEMVLTQYGEKLGIALHPEYITKVLNNAQFVKNYLGHIIPGFVFDQAGVLDMNIVRTFLSRSGISAQEFEKNIEQALIQQQALQYITTASYVPLFDIQQEYRAKQLSKQFSYLMFSLDHYIAEEKKKTITDDELTSFYDTQNMQLRRYWVPEKRSGMMWKFEPKDYNIAVSDEAILAYYEDNKTKQYVLDPLKVEIQQLYLKDIETVTGKSAEEIEATLKASTTEYDKYWKTVKPFSRGEHKGELEKNAFVLQKEGEMSPVFESKKGKTVIKLIRRIPRTYKPLVNVKNDIKEILVNKAFKKEFVKDIKAIISQEDPKAMETFIKDKAGALEKVTDILKDESQVSQQLFSLKKDQYSFFVENGIGIAVKLSHVVERHLPDLNSIKDIVKNDLYEHKARQELESQVSKAQKALVGKTFEDVRSAFNASLNTTDMINPNDHKKLQELYKKGIPSYEMIGLEKEGLVLVHHGERSSFLIKLDKTENSDEKSFKAAEKEIKDGVSNARTRLLLDAAIASLRKNATIETNESILITSEDYSE